MSNISGMQKSAANKLLQKINNTYAHEKVLYQKGRSLGTSLVQDMIYYHNFDVCFYIVIGEHC